MFVVNFTCSIPSIIEPIELYTAQEAKRFCLHRIFHLCCGCTSSQFGVKAMMPQRSSYAMTTRRSWSDRPPNETRRLHGELQFEESAKIRTPHTILPLPTRLDSIARVRREKVKIVSAKCAYVAGPKPPTKSHCRWQVQGGRETRDEISCQDALS